MVLFKKEELKLLWPFYLDSLLSSMFFFAPLFFVVYFRGLGLSLFQVGLMGSLYSLCSLLFEIPTGAVADIYGRKISVRIGALLMSFCLFGIFFVRDYYIIIMLYAIGGISQAFMSGATEALVVDLLKKRNKKLLNIYFSKNMSLANSGLVISGLLGALLVKSFGVSVIWIFASLSLFSTFVIMGFVREDFVRQSRYRIHIKVFNQSSKAIKYARRHHVLFYFLIASVILAFAGSFDSDLSWIPLLQNLNFPSYALGYLWSAYSLIGVFAPFITNKLLRKGKERMFILLCLAVGVIIMFSILLASSIVAVISIFLFSGLFLKLRLPADRIYFHRFIPGRLRATVGSLENMLNSLVYVLAAPLVGLVVDNLGPKMGIFIAAMIMIPAVIVYYLIDERKVKEKP